MYYEWLKREWITSGSDQLAAAVADVSATWQHIHIILYMTLTTHSLVDIQGHVHPLTYMRAVDMILVVVVLCAYVYVNCY